MGMPQFDPHGDLIMDTLKTDQQWWLDRGDLAKPIDLDAAFDRTYIDYAVSVLGKE